MVMKGEKDEKRGILAFALALLLAVSMLAACGDSGEDHPAAAELLPKQLRSGM